MSHPPREKSESTEPPPAIGTPDPPETVELNSEMLAQSGGEQHLEMEVAEGIAPEPEPSRPAPGSTITWPCALKPPPWVDRPTLPIAGLPSFGKFEMLGEIGRGGMGVVYKARDKELDRIVAIKMILASNLASKEQVERFYTEARAAAKLDSPHIVGIHDVGQIHGQHYFAMDYVPGQSLSQVIQAGPIAPETAARYVYAVARGVAQLHAQDVVHRDLKPSNILLDESGRPRVTDFGLAKVLHADGRMTRTGAIVGTPGYMAPEQAAGKGNVGPVSDVYSLGAILYELLTGRPPFSGETPLDTLVQVLEGEPQRPSRLRAGLPTPLERICLKCLEKAPQDRYVSATALAEDLDHFLRGEQVEASRTDPWQHVRRWTRREPALASHLGIMAIGGAIIQVNYTFIQSLNTREHFRSLTVVAIWAAASIAFHALLRKERWADVVRYAWAGTDVILFTVLIHNGLATSGVAGYFLLVAASGLWFRERLVWFTTAMAVAAYGCLVVKTGLYQSAALDSPYRHVLFAAALAVSGLITGYQVKRVRALSQYYEHRPLP